MEQRRDMMVKWADYLDHVRRGAQVIALPGKRACRQQVRDACRQMRPLAEPEITLLCDNPGC